MSAFLSLRDALKAYRVGDVDQPTDDLLNRLAASTDACKAFDRLKLENQRDAAKVLSTCLQASELYCTFDDRIRGAKATLLHLDQCSAAVARLKQFIDKEVVAKPIFDGVSSNIIEPEDSIAAMRHGLALIAYRIEAGRRTAEEDRVRFGATRKSGTKEAGLIAAVGWLAEGIRSATGKPHRRTVADLAEVIFGVTVSEQAASRADATRGREWRRVPLGLSFGGRHLDIVSIGKALLKVSDSASN